MNSTICVPRNNKERVSQRRSRFLSCLSTYPLEQLARRVLLAVVLLARARALGDPCPVGEVAVELHLRTPRLNLHPLLECGTVTEGEPPNASALKLGSPFEFCVDATEILE